MDDAERIRQFWDRWEYQPNRNEQFVRFRNRMLEVANSMWSDYFSKREDWRKEIALISGTLHSAYPGWQYSGFHALLAQAKNEFEVADALRCLLRSVERTGAFEVCCQRIQEALELSPSVMIQLVRHEDKATLYPVGVRLLDRGVVESNVSWLSKYPAVAKSFEEALKLYVGKDAKQYRGMLDNLRFAVEQMLQIVLSNGKTLENQKSEFQTWLKSHGVHGTIGGMYHTLLFGYFTQYQNDAVKHHEDDYTAPEVEFVLYVTGTFLRLVQRLLEQEAAKKTAV